MSIVLVLLTAAVAVGIGFAIVVWSTGGDSGLVSPATDGLPRTLPGERPLSEDDIVETRFDTGLRGYRTTQVDAAMARLAYDIGFKGELIQVLAAEVAALRDGRTEEAETLRAARQRALAEAAHDTDDAPDGDTAPEPDEGDDDR